MQLDHAPAARRLVQAVGVLGDHSGQATSLLHRGESGMAWIRLRGQGDVATLLGDLPVGGGVGQEGVYGRDFDGVIGGP